MNQSEINSAIELLADKLSVGTDELIAMYAAQVPAEIAGAAVAGVAAVAFLALSVAAFGVYSQNAENEGAFVIAGLSGILGGFLGLCATDAGIAAYRAYLSPEAYAVTEILKLLR